MAWSFDKHTPVYLQIAARIRGDIISGVYPPSSQIPPVRQLATVAAVNPNTVQHALTALEGEGLIYSQGTSGRFVTSDNKLLENAKKDAAKEFVNEFLSRAKELSISREELIKLIEEESK